MLLWIGSLPLSAALVLAFAWPLDLGTRDPLALDASWVAFMVRTFSFHGAGALGAAAIAALVLRAPRLGLLSLLVAATTAILSGAAPVASPPPRPTTGAALTLMTSNLWRNLRDVSRLVAQIERDAPDVIVFQEYTPEHDAMLRAALSAAYPYIEAQPQRDFSGMATYSRLPMRQLSGRLLGPRGVAPTDPMHWERQLCCAVEVGTGDNAREVVIQNIHLPTAPMGRSLLAHHHRLVRELADWLADDARPVVCAGDFNCTPMSAEAGFLRAAGLTDAHRAVGTGLGATWGHRLVWPGFRIDHVYTRGLRPLSCRVGQDIGSDHRPVLAVLELP